MTKASEVPIIKLSIKKVLIQEVIPLDLECECICYIVESGDVQTVDLELRTLRSIVLPK